MEKGREETGKLISMEDEIERREDEDLEWFRELGAMIWAEEARMNAVNEVRVRQVELAEEILKRIVIGEDVKIEKSLFWPFPSMGGISVTGEMFEIDDMEAFSKVVSMASNMDICVKTDQTVEMDFTFHGLMYIC